jgi:hypothetical protein
MAISGTSFHQPMSGSLQTVSQDPTTHKTVHFVKDFFKKTLFWGAVAVGVVFSFSLIKGALSNPFTALALAALGVLAYKNKEKIISTVKMYIAGLKDKLGLSEPQMFCSTTNNILQGNIPIHGKNFFKALKDSGVNTVISIMHNDLSVYNTLLSKPILPHEFTTQEIDYIPIKIAKDKELSFEEMNIVADIIKDKTQGQKKIYIHSDLDSFADQMGILAYLIKYHTSNLQDALDQLKQVRPHVKISDECLGRLYKFSLELGKKPA